MRLPSGRTIALLAAVAACSSPREDAVDVRVAPTLLFPKGLLDDVKKLTVTVYEPSATVACDPATGIVTADKTRDKPILTKDLASVGCAAGFKFCNELSIEKNGNDR